MINHEGEKKEYEMDIKNKEKRALQEDKAKRKRFVRKMIKDFNKLDFIKIDTDIKFIV